MRVDRESNVTNLPLVRPTFHVVLWSRSPWHEAGTTPGFVADEYRVRDVTDVVDVLDWARTRSAIWGVYVELQDGDSTLLARIAGTDPSEGAAFEVRAVRD
ncbi:hypothetical protein [Cellulomonas fimi]|uniref:Uncharacterized protein n=1 Tax=Cellulomonas fimi TaxID=1708 RepID=A0A7Y0QI42_CELFI|nr:hypothetical protein [Cellulomonas fimi]NMR20940.1 hypothetical protein [Cellulomonas fimi]